MITAGTTALMVFITALQFKVLVWRTVRRRQSGDSPKL